MFFSRKPANPPASSGAGSDAGMQASLYREVVGYLRSKDYHFEENPDKYMIFFPTNLDTGHYTLLWRVRNNGVTLVAMSPFEVKGCSADEAMLLCSLANSKLINGTFYLDTDNENIFVEVSQRVFALDQFGPQTIGYMLGVMGSNLDSQYMKGLEALCKGYKSLPDVLEDLN